MSGLEPTVVLTPSEVRQLLPMGECMDAVEDALRCLSAGQAVNPLRQMIRLPGDGGILGLMPGYLEAPEAVGFKAIAVLAGNRGTKYDSHQGVVMLFDPEIGVPAAIMDASEVTAIRTAAASGVATRLLARKDAGTLAILGSGVQARTHLEAMLVARPVEHVRIFSLERANCERFARRMQGTTSATIEVSDNARDAVEGASIVCTVTSSKTPVVEGAWLAPGTHVNAVGACFPTTRELDTAAVARSRMFVDRRESAVNESGDFLLAKQEGAIGDDAILGELGELAAGAIEGRRNDEEITLFNSLGVAVEDLAAATLVLKNAREQGVGARVALGGLRDVAD